MSWFGITLNEWLFAGFLIVLVLVVPKLGDFGAWIARLTGSEADGPTADPRPPATTARRPSTSAGDPAPRPSPPTDDE